MGALPPGRSSSRQSNDFWLALGPTAHGHYKGLDPGLEQTEFIFEIVAGREQFARGAAGVGDALVDGTDVLGDDLRSRRGARGDRR